jgi:hypothetical protein
MNTENRAELSPQEQKMLESIKLNHRYKFHLAPEKMKTLIGQEKVIAELAENLQEFDKKTICLEVGRFLGNKTRQSGVIIFSYYKAHLVNLGILTEEKVKRIKPAAEKKIVEKKTIERNNLIKKPVARAKTTKKSK